MKWGHICTEKPRDDVGSLEAGVNRRFGVAGLVMRVLDPELRSLANSVTAVCLSSSRKRVSKGSSNAL